MHAPSHVVAALRALRAGAVALVATLALGLPNARAEVVIIDSIGWTDTTVGPYEPIGIYAAGWMSETFVGLDCAVYDVCNDWFDGSVAITAEVGGELYPFEQRYPSTFEGRCDCDFDTVYLEFAVTTSPLDPAGLRAASAAWPEASDWSVSITTDLTQDAVVATDSAGLARLETVTGDVALIIDGVNIGPSVALPNDLVSLTSDLIIPLPGAPADACTNPSWCTTLDLPPIDFGLTADGSSHSLIRLEPWSLWPCTCSNPDYPGIPTTGYSLDLDINSEAVRQWAYLHPTGWSFTAEIDPDDVVPESAGDVPGNNAASHAVAPFTPVALTNYVALPGGTLSVEASYHPDEVLPMDTATFTVGGRFLLTNYLGPNPCDANNPDFCQQFAPEVEVRAAVGLASVNLVTDAFAPVDCTCDDPDHPGQPVVAWTSYAYPINTSPIRDFAYTYGSDWDIQLFLDPEDNHGESNEDNASLIEGARGITPVETPPGNLAVELYEDMDGYLHYDSVALPWSVVPLDYAGAVTGGLLPNRCPDPGGFVVQANTFIVPYLNGSPVYGDVAVLGDQPVDLCDGGNDPSEPYFWIELASGLDLNTPEVRALFLDYGYENLELVVGVVELMDDDQFVRETTELDNAFRANFTRPFLPLNGVLELTDGNGSIALEISAGHVYRDGFGCLTGSGLAFDGTATYRLAGTSDFPDVTLSIANACVEPVADTDGYRLVYAGPNVDIATTGLTNVEVEGQIDGLAATLYLSLDNTGVTIDPGSYVDLPEGVTAHPRQTRTFTHHCVDQGQPIDVDGCNAKAELAPCGTDRLYLTAPAGWSFATLQAVPRPFSCDPEPGFAAIEYLRAGALPFALHLPLDCATGTCTSSLFVTPNEIVATYDRPEYLRRPNALGASNDARYALPMGVDHADFGDLGIDGTVLVRAGGLRAWTAFEATKGKAHFPRFEVDSPRSLVEVRGVAIGAVGTELADAKTGAHTRATYKMVQGSACGTCTGGAFDATFTFGATTNDLSTPIFEGHRDDGAIAFATRVNANAGFGPTDVHGAYQECTEGGCTTILDERHVFERKSDVGKRAIVWIPGYALPDTASGASVPSSLLGSHVVVDRPDLVGSGLPDGTGPGLADYAGTSFTANNGSFFFAGMTVGPEIQRDTGGQPIIGKGQDLAHTAGNPSEMVVGLGGTEDVIGMDNPDWATLQSNGGTKYVVRPAGLTGAFSFGSGGVQPAVPGVDVPTADVYGYAMAFTRFAFRTRMNTMDPVTWLDGQIVLPGRAGIGFDFKGLQLECTGQLAGGTVVRPPNDPQKFLQAWATPFDPLAIDFRAPAGADACTGSTRKLWVQGNATIAALERPVGLDAPFEPDGEPVAAVGAKVVAGDNVLDKKDLASPGFSVGLAPTAVLGPIPKLNDTLGWFEFGGTLRLPFWETVPVAIRTENACCAGTNCAPSALPECNPTVAEFRVRAEPTIVTQANTKLAGSDTTTNAALALLVEPNAKGKGVAELLARYDWNGSGFELELPGFYKGPSEAQPLPSVLGIPFEASYPFVSVKAGMDFANPERTKVSFGASASLDISRLTGQLFTVDLQDPKSVERIDSFVRDVRGFFGHSPTCGVYDPNATPNFDCHPVASTVGAIGAPATFVLKFAGPGIDSLIRTAVMKAFEAADGPRIVELLANEIGKIKALPGTIIAGIFDGIRQEISKLLSYLTGPLEQAAADMYNHLPAELGAAVEFVKLNANQPLAQAKPVLAQALADLRGLIGNGSSVLGGPLAALDQLLSKAADISKRAKDLVGGVKTQIGVIRDSADFVLGKVDGIIGARTGPSCNVAGSPGLLGDYFTNNVSDTSPPGNALWVKVKELSGQVKGVLEAVNGGATGLIALAEVLTSLVGVDSKALKDVSEKIKSESSKLKTLVDDATARIKSSIAQLPFNAILDKVRETSCRIRGAVTKLGDRVNDIIGSESNGTGLYGLVATIDGVLAKAKGVVSTANAKRVEIAGWLDALLASTPSIPSIYELTPSGAAVAQELRDTLNKLFTSLGIGPWCNAPAGQPCAKEKTFVAALAGHLRLEIETVVAATASAVQGSIKSVMDELPIPSGDQLRELFYKEILDGVVIAKLQNLVHENLVLILSPLNDLGQKLLTHVNGWVKAVFDKFSALVASLLESAQAAFKALPIKGAKVDGYAIMSATELERLHIGAEFEMNKSNSGEKGKENDTNFGAALDVVSWSVNGKAKACLAGASGEASAKSLLDATIKIENVPLNIGTGKLGIKELALGMTLALGAGVQGEPALDLKGINGRIYTSGSLAFAAFELYDMGLELGVGEYETYLGARAKARFSGSQVEAAFLVGKTCNIDVLKRLDPEVGSFIDLPNGVFAGFYVRGALTMPIYNVGCVFTIGAGIEVGFWYSSWLGATTVGGLIGASVYGQAACFVSVRGGFRIMGQVANGKVSAQGTGYAIGGIGFCEPEKWTSIEASRADDWCGKAAATFTASYKNESINIDGFSIDAVY